MELLSRLKENANYGGQAVLEGVMIRGPKALAVAVRRTDGRIVLKKEPLTPLTRRHPLLNVPFIRGAFALADALMTGVRALRFSADVAMEEENERAAGDAGREGLEAAEPALPPQPRIEVRDVAAGAGVPVWSLVFSLLTALGIAVAVFVLFPDFLANLLRGHLPPGKASNALINLLEGLVRVVLFVGYIVAISRMEAIRRVFEYHGAEHQVIYAFENGDQVTPEAAARYDTAHPRCGTSFIGAVILVGILAFSLVDVDTWYLRQAIKLALLPVIGGISYEVIRLAGAGYLTFLVAPGIWLQRLTTRRPDREQAEVAIAALQGALEQEGRSL
ncbi:MAG: DUF1385 domain-containing protein [Armatimonadetes bacterium]|nr:DUF1385 domain-containing protein [Armatimonadota bacterium]